MDRTDDANLAAPVGAAEFKAAMRGLAQSVALVTTNSGGERRGMTVSSFCSVSTDPPRMLACINTGASTYPLLKIGGPLAINVLHAAQEEIAAHFSSSAVANGEDRFSLGAWTTLTSGAPVLTEALSAFDCRIVSIVESASHVLVTADVVAVRHAADASPLLYRNGRFHSLPETP